MAKIYLRPIGGLGARLIPLLQVMSAVRESPHELVVCWPLTSKPGKARSGSSREQSFEIGLSDLYDFDPPVTEISEEGYLAKTEDLPHYPLKHTQNLDGNGQTPVYLREHWDEDFCVDAHGLFQFISRDARATEPSALLLAYLDLFRLKPPQKALYDDFMERFEVDRPKVGVYLRQSRGANYQVLEWDARNTLLPTMRKCVEQWDVPPLFFVVCDEEPLLNEVITEFGTENVVTTPKPHIVNHPDEMLSITVDIELMRRVDIYYPTWGSWLGKLMGLVRWDGTTINRGVLGVGAPANPLEWGYGIEGDRGS